MTLGLFCADLAKQTLLGILIGTPVILAVLWAGLLAGRSGAVPITRMDPSRLGVRFACEVQNFDPLLYIDRNWVSQTVLQHVLRV